MRPLIDQSLNQFLLDALAFLEYTNEFVFQGVNPGGHYTAIWCRDAAHILNDWFVSGGSITKIIEQIAFIWSHQIEPGKEKLIYGRGSPDMNFQISTANKDIEKEFEGALPTTIYSHYNFSEVYGKSPDIDSTALMVSTTSFILYSLLKQEKTLSTAHRYSGAKSEPYKQKEVIDHLVPRMSSAVNYLIKRDIDDDCLLEQSYNEDWMDTVLRAGKIVYSQATWVLALKNFSAFIFELDNKKAEAKRTLKAARKSIDAIDQKLWSQRKNCYVDLIQKENHGDFEYGIITQDVLIFLLAVSENKYLKKNSKNHENDEINMNDYGEESNCVSSDNGSDNSIPETNIHNKSSLHQRSIETLDAVRKIWKGGWPLVTESLLAKTGPAILNPNEYHNYTCWPWMTAIEMLTRSRYDRFEKQDLIFISELISKDNGYGYAFYEWIDPSTETGHGAFPFRTGISCMRLALREIITGSEMHRDSGCAITADNISR